MSRRTRVLLVGPLPVEGSPIGGTQVSFAELVERCNASSALEIDVINTSRAFHGLDGVQRAWVNARALASTVLGIARRARACDVILFNASSGAMLSAGPAICAAARAARKPLAVRLFGGCFDLLRDDAPAWQRALVDRTVMRAPLVLVQTKGLCKRFADRPNVRWFPTTRSMPRVHAPARARCRRFLFLGQLRAEKGLIETLAASDRLPAHASLSVFGPPMPDTDMTAFDRHPRAHYGGVVAHESVHALIARHDALVFPSYHIGEGMPGVVIEALQRGRPVIASTWRALPEIVEHERSGLLVAPRSIDDVASAMNRLMRDDELYARLCRGALSRGRDYVAEPWQAQLESWLEDLASGREPAHGSIAHETSKVGLVEEHAR